MDKNIIQLTSEKQFWFIKQRKNGSFVLKDIFGSTLNYSINDQSIIEKLKMSKGNLVKLKVIYIGPNNVAFTKESKNRKYNFVTEFIKFENQITKGIGI